MKEPVWVSADEASAINRLLVAQFGGLDAGVRDQSLLQAALARPLNKWHYDEPKPDLFVLAAAYAFGIAKGRAFHDGRKRAAHVIAVTFLELNGVTCAPSQSDIVQSMVALAEGTLGESDLAEWFRRNSRRPSGLSEAPAPPIRPTASGRRTSPIRNRASTTQRTRAS